MDIRPADLSKYQEALKAARKYNAANTDDERKEAAQQLHIAYLTFMEKESTK